MPVLQINFDDWWVWKAIDAKYRPRVVVIEYNAAIPLEDSRVIDPEVQHARGASSVGGRWLFCSGCGQGIAPPPTSEEHRADSRLPACICRRGP